MATGSLAMESRTQLQTKNITATLA
jgi:hypothetical protein